MALIWLANSAIPQSFPDLKFSHLTVKDGLSNDNVSGIAQDRDGIIWVGTENGLNRFDGYGFKNFYADANDPKSIPNSFISQIIPDQKNNLWISSSEGIFYFNTLTQTSRAFRTKPDDTTTFRDQHRPYIYLDSNQLPWVTTHDGLYHFKDSIHYERTDKGIIAYSETTKKETNVDAPFVKDKTGQLWGCWENLIFRVNDSSKQLRQIYRFPEHIIFRSIFFDEYNRCWVSSWGKGIYLFDPGQNKWKAFSPSRTRTVVYGAVEWEINGKKILVFACSSPGLFLVDEDDLTTHSYFFDSTNVDLTGLPFVDRQNILWIPTSDGVYYTTPSNNLFSVIPVPPLKNGLAQSMLAYVYNMKEEKSGYWIS
jgi:ligand-binding sensor domain-containing protein